MTFGSTFGRVLSPTFQPKSQAAAGGGEAPTVFYLTKDTMLFDDYPTYNYGAKNPLGVGGSFYFSWLIQFDLSAASGQTIASAKISCYKNDTVKGTYNRTVSVYAIHSNNSGWIEGTKTGALAVSGEPCWDAKEADGAGGVTTAWAGGAGCKTSGTDYVNTLLAQSNHTWNDYNQYDEMPLIFNSAGITKLQAWIDSPSTNYGLIVPNHTNHYGYWFSREESNDSYKPKLVLTYA